MELSNGTILPFLILYLARIANEHATNFCVTWWDFLTYFSYISKDFLLIVSSIISSPVMVDYIIA